ncbi:MAG: hypothetical protein AABY33_07455 [Pseudomonadota bacterium]
MAWIIGIIAIMLFLSLMVASEAFRNFIFFLIALAVVSGFLIYKHNENEDKKSKERIGFNDVILQNVVLITEYSSYKLQGNLKNISKYNLSEITFRVRIYDCPTQEPADLKTCNIIGDNTGTDWINVPPNQIRAFDINFYFSNMPILKGKLVWNYDIVGTKGTE